MKTNYNKEHWEMFMWSVSVINKELAFHCFVLKSRYKGISLTRTIFTYA